ncbi:DUF7557 family protein [Infirmifilum sp. NZ]|uniref:DUF7557 family protein n=1 Tax=Infirmifilum sp. NZ TaxID=2926850 RepID=UPI0027A10D75|nr:hypothetical protein [Infirmifilum sp. NZ]UNQ73327.1 hypothetical protein MOV14_09475 [Infirmifilum sp. NZ]
MKTIAVDEITWKKLKKLREKLGVRSYDEIIDKLIEVWQKQELNQSIVDLIQPSEKSSDLVSYILDRKAMKRENQ